MTQSVLTKSLVLAVWLTTVSSARAGTEASFQGLGDLPGGIFNSSARAVSADATTVVGESSTGAGRFQAFRWTAVGGMVGLGSAFNSAASGVSADGSVIVGRTISSTFDARAFRWTAAGGMVGLGFLGVQPGDNALSNAQGVSADGSVVVGLTTSPSAPVFNTEAFRWTAAGGMVGLGDLPGTGGFSSLANGVSADGSVVVGRGISDSDEPFRWTQAGGMVGLGHLPNPTIFFGQAFAVSSDGATVVGESTGGSGGVGNRKAFRWTAATGMVGLGLLPGHSTSQALAASGDGAVIVGTSRSFVPSETLAFIWDATNGTRNFKIVLETDFGLDLTGWTLQHATGISGDGLTIAGFGDNPSGNIEAWIARLVLPDADGDGVSDSSDLCPTTPPGEVGNVDADGCSCISEDTSAPTITCPPNVAVATDAGICTASGVNLGAPTTDDNCGVASVTDDAPTVFSLGTTTVTWTVTDDSGLITTCTQDVTVTDSEVPTITCPADVTVPADAGLCTASGVNLGAPVTSDNCPGETANNDAPASFPLGDTTVIWAVTDAAGNSATCTQTVTVTDGEVPTIACPVGVAVSADPGLCTASGVSLGVPVTSDNCPGETANNDAPASFPLGDTTVIWAVTDAAGNSATCTQTVTVTDGEAPTITCPADVAVSADAGGCTASGVNLGVPVTSDNCPGETASNDAPALFPVGDTTVTWTVTDASGNTATCTQTVTVTDGEVPTITTCPPDRTLLADANCQTQVPDVTGEATVTDNCDNSPAITQAPVAGTVIGLGATAVTVTVTDAAGNTSNCVVTLTVDANGCNTPAAADADGVSAAIEDAAPNNGDGNSDGIKDSQQDNVASLPNVNGDFVTVASPSGTTLANVTSGDNPSPADAPAGVTFPAGFTAFEVGNLPAGGAVDVDLIVNLPAGATINTYWKFGPEPGNPTPHWYEFLFDGTTGATISGNVITLHLVDGLRGDDDLTVNGVIVDPGAPALAPSDPGAQPAPSADCGTGTCGGGMMMMMPLTLLGLGWLRRDRAVMVSKNNLALV